ncbi:hypothetical protein JTB14_017167 [Gonioctena quinquepunctata]|nr:hypothetical protein JTB14_017167 [Gonioctena quinquepunctata]
MKINEDKDNPSTSKEKSELPRTSKKKRIIYELSDSSENGEISLHDSNSSCDPEDFADLQDCENIETDRETDDILLTDEPEKAEINKTTKDIKMKIRDILKPNEPNSSESHTLLKSRFRPCFTNLQ